MPLVGKSFEKVILTYRDDDGARSRLTIPLILDFVAEFANATVIMNTVADLVSPLIDAVLESGHLIHAAYPQTPGIPIYGSDVEDKGVFVLKCAQGNSATVALPSILESMLVADGVTKGIQLDTSKAVVSNFITFLEDGHDLNPLGIAGWIKPCSGVGFDVVQVEDAYKQNRRSHKSKRRKG